METKQLSLNTLSNNKIYQPFKVQQQNRREIMYRQNIVCYESCAIERFENNNRKQIFYKMKIK